MPLQENEVARKVVWQLDTKAKELTRHARVIVYRSTWWGNVGTRGIARIFGCTVELICHKCERIIFEAISSRFTTRNNRTSKEFKVALMMSREYDVYHNFLALRILSLNCRCHRLAKHVQIVVIAPTIDYSTLSDGATSI